jgi:hypothetical protein
MENKNKQFNIRKRIASAGCNNIIVIPKILQDELKKGTIVDIQINVFKEAEKDEK